MHDRHRWGLVALSSIAVALIAAASVYVLAAWARQSAEAELELMELKGELQELDSLEWQAIARGVVDDQLIAEITNTKSDSNTRLQHLISNANSDAPGLVSSPIELDQLQRLQMRYIDVIDQEIALIRSGQIEAAEEFDESEVDPAFDAVAREIESLAAQRKRSKLRVARFADVGMLASMLLAAITISALFWRFSRTREREAHKLADALSALSKSEERWQFALSGAGFAVWDRKLATRDEYSSPRWREILGYSSNDVFDNSVRAWELSIHPEDLPAALAQMDDLWAGKCASSSIEYRCKAQNGQWIWVLSRGAAVEMDAGGKPQRVIGIREDITETKHLREQVAQTQKMQTIGQFAGGIAHDFNNNLTAIMMSIDMLALEDRLSDDGKRTLHELSNTADHAAKTTAQLLQFARRQPAQMKTYNLAEALRKLSTMLRRLIGERIDLQLELPEAAWIRADQNLVDQAVVNLVLNARDAMPEGGRLAILLQTISIDFDDPRRDPEIEPGQFVRIAVTDTGIGIAEHHMSRLFEPFFTTKGVGKGTGLGLASVHGMARQHQGWAQADSKLGVGSVFEVYLPASTAPQAADASVQTPVTGEVRTSTHLRAPAIQIAGLCGLLVEDEPQVRQSVLRMLEHLGCRVYVAECAASAQKLWQEKREEINFMLTDLIMPGQLNGMELALEIRRQGGSVPTLIMSGYPADALRGSLSERMRFLPKPFDVATFRQSLTALLATPA
jgi:PAS domain S-box-containing protein